MGRRRARRDPGVQRYRIELCDSVPSYIEQNKAEWFDSVGSWCPWSARVTAVTAR